jgi:signal transduction histidine kinase
MIWCVAIFCVLLVAVSVVLFRAHAEAHAGELDRTLAAVTTHFQSEIERALEVGVPLEPALQALDLSGAEVAGAELAFFDGAGMLIGGQPLPQAAQAVSGSGAGAHPAESFQTVSMPSGRMRVHTMLLVADGETRGYVQSRVSLVALDSSIARFRMLLMATVAGGLLIAAVGSLVTATRALHPIADVTETARAIALSRGFGRRLEPIGQRDELGELVSTFNEMLDSLDAAYRTQRQFVDDAAHELRAPVTSIVGNLDLLERARDLPAEEQRAIAAETRTEVERLGRLVNDLLALARADAGLQLEQAAVELDRVVADAVRAMRPLTGDVALTVAALESAVVIGDADRLKQLLIILIDNAQRYTPAGGRVRVSLRRQGDEAVLAVEDTGIGIGAADVPRIFDRFYRADPARSRDAGGSGLGLAIAKWIAEAHDGRIEVESAPGAGATFRVRLPLMQSPPPLSGAEPGSPRLTASPRP